MKIISGEFKGKIIKGFNIEGTRPTMDRVKESLFGTVQNYITDRTVLDLFAGTGNLGFEALSNHAKYCYFNDKNIKCINFIKKTIDELNINERTKVLNMNYNKALEYFANNNIKFDLIFLDPPYKMEVLNEIIKEIKNKKLINKNGLIICEVDTLYLNIDYYEKIKEKKYGNKYIIIYKNNL
ncbi:MAG: 16S rRNA (guanine(966)-N(2))-methyltransferase RsmD [Bacilli bacterium]|nr:16S rRNA (guanine(966)-N(2))-methyltransferase RsmD [Bacilli bacterium]